MQRVLVGIGVNGDRLHAHLAQRADDATRNGAAVGDQDFSEHERRSWQLGIGNWSPDGCRNGNETRMAKFALDELRVYAMAEELADLVWDVVITREQFPNGTVGHQLVRAADSVGANIAEGYGRASPADHQRFIRTARGSLYEVRHFFRRSDKRRLLAKEQKAPLQQVLKELLPALNAYLRSLGTHSS